MEPVLLAGTTTALNNVSVSGGTLRQNNTLTINGGNLTTSGAGAVDTTSGTATVTINGTGGTIGGGGTVAVYNLVLGGSSTETLASALTTSSDISVPTGKTLSLGGQNVTVNGGDFTTINHRQ